MTDTEQARLVRPWYAWELPAGQLFRTPEEARDHPPTKDQIIESRTGVVRLLRQYRFEDDGSFCGIAEPVR